MELQQLVTFNDAIFFDGAVQLDWFYDSAIRDNAATHFVFHGPKYLVSQGGLIDTATFLVRMVNGGLSTGPANNPFALAIAGYGGGKSHLGLTLASFLAGDPFIRRRIIENVSTADASIGQDLMPYIMSKPALISPINGMKDVRLSTELLRLARKTLALYDLSDEPLATLGKPYAIAKHFVSMNFDVQNGLFREHFVPILGDVPNSDLKQKIIASVMEPLVFDEVNHLYKIFNGTEIRVDDGISADDIIDRLVMEYCGPHNFFQKLVIVFDEFGRYIQFAASNPGLAGDAALQQIFEGIQRHRDYTLFLGLVQADLGTYLRQVNADSNIERYIGRFNNAVRYRLSTNLESLFANLLIRPNSEEYEKLIRDPLRRQGIVWRKFQRQLVAWNRELSNHTVWSDGIEFQRIIVEGSYPLSPLATLLLSRSTEFLQNRTSLMLLRRVINGMRNEPVERNDPLPFYEATDLMETPDFFEEIVLAEENGKVPQSIGRSYWRIRQRLGDRLGEQGIKVLLGIVGARLLGFRFKDRHDALEALKYFSDYSKDHINDSVKGLEDDFGVISFDESEGVFTLLEEGIGFKDFLAVEQSLRGRARAMMTEHLLTNEVKGILGIDSDSKFDTEFGVKYHIISKEWVFTKEFIRYTRFNEDFVTNVIRQWKQKIGTGEEKGHIVFVYRPAVLTSEDLGEIRERAEKLKGCPIMVVVLQDVDAKWHETLQTLWIRQQIAISEPDKFRELGEKGIADARRLLSQRWTNLLENGLLFPVHVSPPKGKLSTNAQQPFSPTALTRVFESVYQTPVPFPFDGFKNVNTRPAQKVLSQLARRILSGEMNYQQAHLLAKDEKNRLDAVLTDKSPWGWGVVNSDKYTLQKPRHSTIQQIFASMAETVGPEGSTVGKWMTILTSPPYGMNSEAASLLVAVYLASNRNIYGVTNHRGVRQKLADWATTIYTDKELSLSELSRTRVIMLDSKAEDITLEHWLEKIKSLADTEQIDNLLQDYNRIDSSLLNEDVQEKILWAYNQLQSYKKMNEDWDTFLHEQRDQLKGVRAGRIEFSNLISTAYDLKYGTPDQGPIGLGSTQTNRLSALKTEVQDLLIRNLDKWTQSLRCKSVGDMTSFKATHLDLASKLRKLGFDLPADRLKHRVLDELDHVETIRVQEAIEPEFQAFMGTSVPTHNLNFTVLKGWMDRGTALLNTVSTAKKLTDRTKEHYTNALQDRLKALDAAVDNIKSELATLWHAAGSIDSEAELIDWINSANSISERGLSEVDMNGIRSAIEEARKLLKWFHQETAASLDLKYSVKQPPEAGLFALDGLISDLHEQRVARIYEAEAEWSSRWLNAADISRWTIAQCLNWKQHTEQLPEYVVSTLKMEKVTELRAQVERRIRDLNIDGVVSAFRALPPGARKDCLLLLMREV